MRVSRRQFSTIMFGAALTVEPAVADTPSDLSWMRFRDRFVTQEGRIVDNRNGDVSHSEGQGYGLILAHYYDDRGAFDRILGWTREWLRRDDDHLHAWRYEPNRVPRVADRNNATDGDLLIAYALSRAGRGWQRPEFVRQAGRIYADVARLLVRETDGRMLLLPGLNGFVRPNSVVVNASYLVFPALADAVSLGDKAALWRRVTQDGVDLIDRSRFGRWNLPPDWLDIGAGQALSPAPDWPARFSYDAVRIPLYLFWARLLNAGRRGRFAEYWSAFGDDLPAWVDLKTDASAPYPAPAGIQAIADCTGRAMPPGSMPAVLPSISASTDYYSAALALLSHIAWLETQPS